MPNDQVISQPSEKLYQNPVFIVGISAFVIVVAVALVVVFKPEWLGGKPPNLNRYVLTAKRTPANSEAINPPFIKQSASSSIPSPTPNTGPGPWACDPNGVCNRYGATAEGSGCPKTFADSACLKQCGNKEARCAKF